jgi:hypothetical protein
VLRADGVLETDTSFTKLVSAHVPGLKDGTYRLSLTYNAGEAALVDDSLYVDAKDDKTAPTVERFTPGTASYYAEQVDLSLTFSEPVDASLLSDQSFILWESDSLPLMVDRRMDGPFTVDLTPSRMLPGKAYRLDIAENEVADLSGNQLGDSILSYSFSTLDRDSLGSLSGRVAVLLPDRVSAPVVMSLERVGKSEVFHLTAEKPPEAPGQIQDTTRTFRAFSIVLPPGQYLLSGFVDQNRDGKRNLGGVDPYELAETLADFPDTVSVRARFETSGILFEID